MPYLKYTVSLFILWIIFPCLINADNHSPAVSATEINTTEVNINQTHLNPQGSLISESTFKQANQLLEQSNQYQSQSRAIILTANKTRKKIALLRAKSRNEKNPALKETQLSQANELAEQLKQQQKEGAKLRGDSASLRSQSIQLFEQGLVARWSQWIKSRAPLTMDKNMIQYFSHNAQIRSVHPSMLNKMATAESRKSQLMNKTDQSHVEQTRIEQAMTLKIAALTAQNAPPNLDINAFQLSNNQHYIAHIEVNLPEGEHLKNNGSKNNNEKNETLNHAAQIPLNQMHQWRLVISDKNGVPVTHAKIDVLGHMPGHVHGLPTQPMVTQEMDDGVYLVEGLKFQMQGWWVMKFNVSANNVFDSFTFNLVL